jgi:hypothetical protein
MASVVRASMQRVAGDKGDMSWKSSEVTDGWIACHWGRESRKAHCHNCAIGAVVLTIAIRSLGSRSYMRVLATSSRERSRCLGNSVCLDGREALAYGWPRTGSSASPIPAAFCASDQSRGRDGFAQPCGLTSYSYIFEDIAKI